MELQRSRTDVYLTSLQAGRGLAALLVVLYHTSLFIFGVSKFWNHDPTRGVFRFGHAGVAFFFVLSGFILAYVHDQDFSHPERVASYAWRRFVRIYPLYWVVLVPFALALHGNPGLGEASQRVPSTTVGAFLLVYVGSHDTVLAVAWTLYHEVLFYAVFALAIVHRRAGMLALGAWLLASVVVLVLGIGSFPASYLVSPLHLLFGLGMLLCAAARRITVPVPMLVALAGAALFFALGLEEDYAAWLATTARDLLYGGASGLALLGAMELERQGRLRVPGALRLLGDASYAIYLVHFPLLSVVARACVKAGLTHHVPGVPEFVAVAAIPVVAGTAVHLWIERPILRRLRRARSG